MALMQKLAFTIAWAFCAASGFAQAAESAIRNGVGTTPTSPPNFLSTVANFDPPSRFYQAVPLKSYYINQMTTLKFTRGNGVVLNSKANFGVSKFSPPNYLAFNCSARNLDNTTPALPMRIQFTTQVTHVSLNAGSETGGIVVLTGYDVKGVQIASSKISAKAILQTIAINHSGIKTIQISGPCILIVDDIQVDDFAVY